MGKKGGWFSSVKKALSPSSKKSSKSSKKGKGKEEASIPVTTTVENVPIPQPDPVPVEEPDLTEVEDEQTKHAYSVAVATAAAAEAAVVAAQAAAEVVRLTSTAPYTGKSLEEVAAIKIQTAFRGYQARRALRALRGLVRLKTLVDGPTAKRQTANAMKCMQALSRVHSQINSRRIRMLEENRALQRQLLQKRAKELESLRMGEVWDTSLQSKEQIEANLLHKYEATMRRERALAYSYSHQQTWKKSSRSSNLLFMDPTNPHWGWSWLERWMAARPWEQGIGEKELNGDQSSVKSASLSNIGEITKAFARHQLNSDTAFSPTGQNIKNSSNHESPSTPTSKPIAPKKLRSASPRVGAPNQDDDARSVFSVQSERNRRHSIATTSIRDDESLSSSASVPSYMAPTKSAKAKTKLQSPLGVDNGAAEKAPIAAAKKRLSYPPSPARPRQNSGAPRANSITVTTHETNGGINE
ncbi:OLC1v1015659C1 [Oldenlandia corymbosa var. corymbosa]|uniref:OLC1v1015659C1 n=1 Tax=Oldenlandia corymbosa var. corymbosa TaxID=529605 RepID=A0AAV1E6R0_OLDCO|nr:OLC1v1015659C1 [Oldenlandia corymbosa var. corymbosa]